MKTKSQPNKRGPIADTLKIEGNWESAIDKALTKKRPKDGWPAPKKKRGRRK